jgi:hypothetical protein
MIVFHRCPLSLPHHLSMTTTMVATEILVSTSRTCCHPCSRHPVEQWAVKVLAVIDGVIEILGNELELGEKKY